MPLALTVRLDASGRWQPDWPEFNREYKRLFGAAPIRHVERVREAAIADAEL